MRASQARPGVRQLRAEVTRLATAIATSSTKSDALVKALDERERRLRDLDARLRAAKAAPSARAIEASNWLGTSPRTSYALTMEDRSGAATSVRLALWRRGIESSR